MSCALTVAQVLARTKTVTRRTVNTWKDLQPGDRLTLIEKGMGLPKGAQQVVLAEVEIISNTIEQLISGSLSRDLPAEGFPDLNPAEFGFMWAKAHGYRVERYVDLRTLDCRRIEWRYLDIEVAA